MNTGSAISRQDYLYLRDLLREQIGYNLTDGKEYLIDGRLGPIAASFELGSVTELLERLRRTGDRSVRQAIVEAMTINETYFFRATRMFESFSRVMLPELIRTRADTRRVRIWCAACSTGQEPYSIAMTLADHFPELDDWRVDLLATDIAEQALERARQGVYNQFEVQRGLPIQSLLNHFTKVGDHWKISDALRRRVRFDKFNLMDTFFGLGGPFDVIFIRNVLIYVEPATASSVFAKLNGAIARDGYLVLGESETILGHTSKFALPDSEGSFYRPVI